MDARFIERLTDLYLDVRSAIIERGFGTEIDWQEDRNFHSLKEPEFLREIAWVILSAGMKETVVRAKFDNITAIFFNWRSSSQIVAHSGDCYEQSLRVFNHEGKISGIVSAAMRIYCHGFEWVKQHIADEGIGFLRSFDYIGPVTCFHLAKNIGLEVAKPDRHLVRIAELLNFPTPIALCEAIADITGDRVAVVDLVLWRFATLFPGYRGLFESLVGHRGEHKTTDSAVPVRRLGSIDSVLSV